LKLVQKRAGQTLELSEMALQLGEMIGKWDSHKIEKLLHNKRNGHQIEEAAQLYIRQGINNENIQAAQKSKLQNNQ
jgi:hypothetical protein